MSDLGWFLQPAVFPWLAFGIGLCVGSFLNVVIHRLPKMMEREWLAEIPDIIEESPSLAHTPDTKRLAGELRTLSKAVMDAPVSLVVPRSRCPGCGSAIKSWQNVPVLSWLLLRGKCANCKAPISLRYPLVELLAGVGAWYCAYRFGFGMQALAATVFLWFTIALAFIDQATGYLPDDITLPLLWAGLLCNAIGAFVPLHEAVIGAAAGYLSLWSVYWAYKLVRGVEGMGYGDFKMTAAVGAFVGWKYLFLVILLSACVGLAFGLAQMIAARRGWDAAFRFHFGPYIAIAGVAALLWGPAILAVVPALRPF